jgi:protein O-mannosyl-transferase
MRMNNKKIKQNKTEPGHPLLNNKKVLYLLLALLCFLVYANSLFNAFVYDDYPGILENTSILRPEKNLFNPQGLLLGLNHFFSGENPFTYHLSNLIIHSLNSILVFVFLQFFFKIEPSFLGAAIFAVHPIHTEAVTWITGGGYLLMALYVLVTYILYRRATDPLQSNKKVNFSQYLFCLGLFFYLIIGNFTFYALAPILIILSDITFAKWRKTWKLWLPFLVIILIRMIFLRGMITERLESTAQEMAASGIVWSNPLPRMVASLFVHFWLMIWPAKLTLYHEPLNTPPVLIGTGLIALVAVVYLLPRIFRKTKELFFALGLFVMFLAPTYSPVVMTSLIGERYIYIPSIALSIAFGFFYQKYVLYNADVRKKSLIVFALLLFVLSIRTILRNTDWKDSSVLWRKTLETAPQNPWSHNNMGYVYQQEGNSEEAIREYERAIELKPNMLSSYNNLGSIYYSLGKNEEAIAVYKRLLEINPRYIKAYNNLGSIYSSMGRKEEALAAVKTSIEIDANYAIGYFNLAGMYKEMGKADESERYYLKAIELDPHLRQGASSSGRLAGNSPAINADSAEGHNALGVKFSMSNRHEEAIAEYKKAVELRPDFADAYNNLGNAYNSAGKPQEAIAAYEKAIDINPRSAVTHFNLAVGYFERKDYDVAATHLDIALAMGYQAPQDFIKLLEPYRKNKLSK